MVHNILIRSETDTDVGEIAEVTVAAFKTMEISNQTEHFIIAALRVAKALTISLVAEVGGRVIGHIAFSPLTISDGTQDWYGLGPVSVLPEYQRQGIGKALIEEGLSRLKDMKARGCCLVGHPEYYRKFGFENMSGLVHEGVPPEVFFALSFDGHIPPANAATPRPQSAPASITTKISPAFTDRPFVAGASITFPDTGAVSSFCIFIASTTTTGSPR